MERACPPLAAQMECARSVCGANGARMPSACGGNGARALRLRRKWSEHDLRLLREMELAVQIPPIVRCRMLSGICLNDPWDHYTKNVFKTQCNLKEAVGSQRGGGKHYSYTNLKEAVGSQRGGGKYYFGRLSKRR